MAATFLTLRYGTPAADGARPNVIEFSYPLWLLDGPPRRVQRERLLEVDVQEGSIVDSLGQDPVTFAVKLLLRPGERPGTQTQDVLNGVRRVLGQGVAIELGSEDWGDGWRLKDLREEYRTWNLPGDTGGTAAPVPGGVAIAAAAVELLLVKGVAGEDMVLSPRSTGLPPGLVDVFDVLDDE